MIWFSLLIPTIVLIVLILKFNEKLVFPEVIGLVLAPIAIALICKYTCQYVQTKDIEFWGGWGRSAAYFEHWNEYIHQTCTRSYPCGSDSKGNTTYCTETYDCSYVADHPEYWQLNGSNGEELDITKGRFEELSKRWNNRSFVNMHRNYYTINGNKYNATWDNKRETLEPITSQHNWTNKVKASKSVFNFQPVDPKKYGLFEYPPITEGYRQINILGDSSTTTVKCNTDLSYWNAVLGAKKRMRVYILIFKDKPIEAGIEQQAYWKNGKKNEFVVTVGIDKEMNVRWCYVFSWSDIEQLKVDAKNLILNSRKLDLDLFIQWFSAESQKKFVKKNFHDFDYLSIDPPGWVVLLSIILAAITSIGIAIYSVKKGDY